MRLGGERPSRNVEDRRGQKVALAASEVDLANRQRLPGGRGGGGLGIGGILLLVGVMWFLGVTRSNCWLGRNHNPADNDRRTKKTSPQPRAVAVRR